MAREAFAAIAADREGRGEVMGSLPAQALAPVRLESVHYRPCPCCAKFMNRENYAHISGVVLDLCKEHGLWFDRDELRQVLAFIEGGGLVRSRDRQVQELEEGRRQAAVPTMPAQGGAWTDELPESHSPSLGLNGMVESLVHLFFR